MYRIEPALRTADSPKFLPMDYVFPGSVSGVMVALQYVVVLAVSLPDFSILGFPVGSD